jgi:hypothetical protein
VRDFRDFFVALKRNVYGAVYGFVRFPKVRDVTKLLHSLNAVCFGQFRIHAKEAWFGRTVVRD